MTLALSHTRRTGGFAECWVWSHFRLPPSAFWRTHYALSKKERLKGGFKKGFKGSFEDGQRGFQQTFEDLKGLNGGLERELEGDLKGAQKGSLKGDLKAGNSASLCHYRKSKDEKARARQHDTESK